MRVKWNELQDAYEYVSFEGPLGEHYAWLCRATGRIYTNVNEDGELIDLSYYDEDAFDGDEAPDDPEKLPRDILDEDKYLPIPGRKDLDLASRLVFKFAREVLPNDYDEIRRIFSKRGAYSRFKDLLTRRKAVDQWYDFENKATEKALREWCELNSIAIEEPPESVKL